MFTIEAKIPTRALTALVDKMSDLAGENGPLVAVGEHIVHDWMPSMFSTSGHGTWDPVLRGGLPLNLTGQLAGGFAYSMGTDQHSVFVTNHGREEEIQGVHNFGATISAVNVPFLTFKVGDRWVKKKSVDIPARPIFVFLPELRDECIHVAQENLTAHAHELFPQ